MKKKVEVVSLSGGRTSGRLTKLKQRQSEAEGIEVEFVFMDTGAEHPNTYAFIKDMVKNWGIDITCLRVVINPTLGKANYYKKITVDEIGNDLQPWKDMIKKYGNPYVGGEFCTRAMKGMARTNGNTEGPFYKYCDEKYGKGNFTAILGIRADEPNRLTKKPNIGYLADICDYEKHDVLDWWERQDFDLDLEEWLGNCVFCIKKSVPKLLLAIKDEPELAEEFAKMIESNEVRKVTEEHGKLIMYRGKNTFRSLMQMAGEASREDLLERVKASAKSEKGSCSDSCEPLSLSDNESVSIIEIEDNEFNEKIRNLNMPKKQKGVRNRNDWYPTSYSLAEQLIEKMRFFTGDTLLDPCKGNKGNEPFYESFPEGLVKQWAEITEGVNFLKSEFSADVIISNPPFDIADQFIRKGIEDLNDGGTMIYLLKLNFLGTKGRFDKLWIDENLKPKMIISLAQRPSFTGDGKTDNAEYAFFVWGDTSRFKDQSPFQWMSWR